MKDIEMKIPFTKPSKFKKYLNEFLDVVEKKLKNVLTGLEIKIVILHRTSAECSNIQIPLSQNK